MGSQFEVRWESEITYPRHGRRGGLMVIKADSKEAALKKFDKMTLFDGCTSYWIRSVEVNEIID